MDEPHVDETQPDQSGHEGDGENFGDTKVVPEPGTEDAGERGEDGNILGKPQDELDADDLKGDARSTDDQ